jgi:hypothetical protein
MRDRSLYEDVISTPLRYTTISVRACNALNRAGIHTIEDLIQYCSKHCPTEIRSIGQFIKEEIKDFLQQVFHDPSKVIISIPGSDSFRDRLGNDTTVEVLLSYGFLEKVSIENTPLTIRVRNALLRDGVYSVGDLLRLACSNGIERVRNIGAKGAQEVWEYIGSIEIGHIEVAEQEEENARYQFLLNTFQKLPVSLFTSMVPRRSYEQLLLKKLRTAANIFKIVVDAGINEITLSSSVREPLRKQIELLLSMDPADALTWCLESHKKFLGERLSRKIIHPRTTWSGNNIISWLTLDPKPHELMVQLQALCAINEAPSVSFEIERIFNLKEREIVVFIQRYGSDQKTLEEIGKGLDISRERVRQIEGKALREIWRRVEAEPNIILRSSFEFARDWDYKFVWDRWYQRFEDLNILGSIQKGHIFKKHGFTEQDILFSLINSSKKEPAGQELVPDTMRFCLAFPSTQVKSLELISQISRKQRKKIFRKIAYTGGISLGECKEILGLTEEEIYIYLDANNLIQFDEGWFTFSDASQFGKCPIITAGLKLYEACVPLPLQKFLRGIRRYSGRFYPSLAPQASIKHVLELYGFTFFEGKVYYPGNYQSRLSGTERLFLRLLWEMNSVLSFYEIVSLFLENGYSKAGATVSLLSHSPLPVKVDRSPDQFTYYTLRGRKISWEQLIEASERQKKISLDARHEYSRDGSIKYYITLNTWAVISGVLPVHSLPNLSGEWEIVVHERSIGSASMDEAFMWGLYGVMEELECELGGQIEVTFNTWERIATFRKINHGRQ